MGSTKANGVLARLGHYVVLRDDEKAHMHKEEYAMRKTSRILEKIFIAFCKGVVRMVKRFFTKGPHISGFMIIALLLILLFDIIVWGVTLGIDAADILVNFIDDIFSIINSAIGVASSVASFFSGSHVQLGKIPKMTASQIFGSGFTELVDIKTTCEKYRIWYNTLLALVHYMTSAQICFMLRFLYPVSMFYVPMNGMIGWMTYPAAPYPGENCTPPPGGSDVCMWLGMGFVIRDFLILVMVYVTIIVSFEELLMQSLQLLKYMAILFFELLKFLDDLAYDGAESFVIWMLERKQRAMLAAAHKV